MRGAPTRSKEVVERYELHSALGAGGMATVHLARFRGAVGFARAVAVKRVHKHLANNPAVAASFANEARTASRVHHPNVVRLLDVVAKNGEVLLVLEYVSGESLAGALAACSKRSARVPLPIVSRILCDVLEGLHAAHEAVGEDGEPLEIVHRDVSPQNVLLGADGVARVLDFGIAKALANTQEPTTKDGVLKGKVSYLAPEQLSGARPDRRVDVYAAGIILWEALAGQRLFAGKTPGAVIAEALSRDVPPPSTFRGDVSPELDAVVARAIERHRDLRFSTAREMAIALEAVCPPAMSRDVASWLEEVSGDAIRARVKLVREMEGSSSEPAGVSAPLTGENEDENEDETVSVATIPDAPAVRGGRRRRFAIASVLLGVSVVVGVGVQRGCRPTSEPAERVTTTESAESTDVDLDMEPESIELPATSATASGVPSARSLPRRKPRSRPSRSGAPCANPFRVDEHGVRIPRPECF